MTIKSVLLFSFLCFAVFLYGETAGNGSTPESWAETLKGDVSDIREYSGESLDALVLRRSICFDRGNNPVSEDLFDGRGELKSRNGYLYSEGGSIVEIRGTDGEDVRIWTYDYAYDDDGRLTRESSADGDGREEWSESYFYNEAGLLQEMQKRNAEGDVSLRSAFQYGEDGRLKERTTFFGDGSLLKRVVFIYGDRGDLLREERYDGNGLYEVIRYVYEEKRLVLRKSENGEGSLKKNTIFRFGPQNLPVAEEIYLPDGTLESGVYYLYDEQGNWVRKWDLSGGYTLRLIGYHRGESPE